MREQAEKNKISWEYRAYEARSSGETISEKAKGILENPESLLRYHAKYFDGVKGKYAASVCGSDGRRAIALAALGAEATVFDISEAQKKYALELAEAVGVKIEYILGDFCETDITKYGNVFDFVYLEGGIIHYFSDIDIFMKMLCAITKPNGRLILSDFHPYRKINGNASEHTDGNYFDSRLYNADAPLRVCFPEEEHEAFPKLLLRYYTMSEIINSVISSGFVLKEFIEHPQWNDATRPAEFTIIAHKIEH
jgi:SAM-dependent methyltransferase